MHTNSYSGPRLKTQAQHAGNTIAFPPGSIVTPLESELHDHTSRLR